MQEYSLFQRQKGKKKFYYVQFKVNGKYANAQSVETLAKRIGFNYGEHVNTAPMANTIVQKAIDAGCVNPNRHEDKLFIDYLISFWTYDTSSYIAKENMKNPDKLAIGRDYASNMLGCVKNHIKPNLPTGLKCSEVNEDVLRTIQENIIHDSGVNVWLSSLKSISTPIKELRKNKVLFIDPLFYLDKYTASQKSSVGVLTERETENLLRQMYYDMFTPFEMIYEHKDAEPTKRMVKLDPRVYYATALSCDTGMRKGEILGLHVDDIRFPNAGDSAEEQALIDIKHAYASKQGFKTPKSKVNRTVPVSKWLALELIELAETNPHGNGLVFYSDSIADHPIDMKVFNKWFNREVNRIGIDEEERTKRHIIFHSLRHYANTEYRTRVGDEKTQRVLGHTSVRMTDRYDAGSDKRVLEIGRLAGNIINNPKEAKEA